MCFMIEMGTENFSKEFHALQFLVSFKIRDGLVAIECLAFCSLSTTDCPLTEESNSLVEI